MTSVVSNASPLIVLAKAELIEYSRLNPGSIALLDDRAARKVASIFGVKAYGTLSIAARHASRNPSVSFEN